MKCFDAYEAKELEREATRLGRIETMFQGALAGWWLSLAGVALAASVDSPPREAWSGWRRPLFRTCASIAILGLPLFLVALFLRDEAPSGGDAIGVAAGLAAAGTFAFTVIKVWSIGLTGRRLLSIWICVVWLLITVVRMVF